MKKAPFALAAAALMLTACGSSSTGTTAESGVFLISEGKLTVCTNPPYAPFEYEENGKIVGLDADIAAAIASDLGVEAEMFTTSFEGIQSGVALSSKQCDIALPGITITDERKTVMSFTDSYVDDNLAILVPAGSDIKGDADLSGRNIGVQQATSGEKYAQEAGANTVQYEDNGLLLQAVQTGQVDAIVGNITVLSEMLTSDSSLSVVQEIETGEQIAGAVATENTALLDSANATLKKMEEDGRLADLREKYLGVSQ
ncbi:amino acid ABC transporter substrate-binding protein [Rothia nasimurium]|uniref:Amino acid ABC transporter substrate-binding protein n=1 Tax=Rothia nasimurium TaxID=85336 RepID=A0A4Y9F2N5_9MICC|nr:ABC transporter substrate-binding protein [Rothia nasimurium]MBF0809339.1 amino acid ABC transporter substrate-binding protein [Rothia nasimurium]TFU19872.1 amino acid ABC transporter substrate-binding protein [Rothia nasimurium]